MDWDLGFLGVVTLLGMAAAFGLVAQLFTWRTTHWMWAIAGATYFVAGLFISEVWFGWATEEDLQPNIDGLSFDEVLLIGLLPGIAAVLAARFILRRQHAPQSRTGHGGMQPHG